MYFVIIKYIKSLLYTLFSMFMHCIKYNLNKPDDKTKCKNKIRFTWFLVCIFLEN
jgi:hypothetical protein